MIHHLKRRCVKHAQLIDVMTDEIVIFKMNKQIKDQMDESKKIVAEQLQGVSDVMDHFAKEIVKERKRHENQEIQILGFRDRKSTRLNSSHVAISYAVFCLKKNRNLRHT